MAGLILPYIDYLYVLELAGFQGSTVLINCGMSSVLHVLPAVIKSRPIHLASHKYTVV